MYIHLKKYKINIPNIKDIGIYEKYKYIVMELLNITLKEYVNKNTDIETLAFYMFDLINPFHERMLIHRDIKPENFIFDKKWNLYIIDLGLSTFVSNRKMYTFIGNKLYASYNCHKSEYIYEQNDDLISIIYMLLHLYTGSLPWDKIHFDYGAGYKSNSECHSRFYDSKKNTNYKEFYKNINKYDRHVETLISLYNDFT